MKGVVLAGGKGSRLYPLTKITNKHLLPVYDRPMIYYPVQTLVNAGIRDILVVTGGNHAGDFLQLLGNGREFGLTIVGYSYQEGEGGIADALKLAEDFAEGEKICVILGDNIMQNGIGPAAGGVPRAAARREDPAQGSPRSRALRRGRDRRRQDRQYRRETQQPKSNYAVTGIYMYDQTVFEKARELKPSARGELEITDVNNAYIQEGTMTYAFLEGWWTDAGTFESLLRASNLVAHDGQAHRDA